MCDQSLAELLHSQGCGERSSTFSQGEKCCQRECDSRAWCLGITERQIIIKIIKHTPTVHSIKTAALKVRLFAGPNMLHPASCFPFGLPKGRQNHWASSPAVFFYPLL